MLFRSEDRFSLMNNNYSNLNQLEIKGLILGLNNKEKTANLFLIKDTTQRRISLQLDNRNWIQTLVSQISMQIFIHKISREDLKAITTKLILKDLRLRTTD